MIAPSLPAGLYPFSSRWLDLGGYRYHYVDEGQGEPLLMLHGNPTWSFYYRHLIDHFRRRHRVVAPDHMGCGLSDKPQLYPYRLARHIDNLEALVEHLDLRRLTLVLHDWGGPIGMGLAARHPERIHRLVLFNTAAFPSPRMPWAIALCRLPILGELLIRGLNLFAGLGTRVNVHRPMSPEVRAGYLAPYDSWAHRVALWRFVQDIPTSPRHPSWATLVSIQESLPRFADRPALLVWGERDFVFTRAFLDDWRGYLPRARVRTLPDAGHYVVEDAWERIIPWMEEFLET